MRLADPALAGDEQQPPVEEIGHGRLASVDGLTGLVAGDVGSASEQSPPERQGPGPEGGAAERGHRYVTAKPTRRSSVGAIST